MPEKGKTAKDTETTVAVGEDTEPVLGGPAPDQSLPPLAEDTRPVCATCGFDPDSKETRKTSATVEQAPQVEGMGEPIEEERVVNAPACPTCGELMDVEDISNLTLVSKH